MKNHRRVIGWRFAGFIFASICSLTTHAALPTLIQKIPNSTISTNALLTIPLPKYIKADLVPANLVRVSTTIGSFNMELLPEKAPKTVANFLAYVNDSAYENTLVHRSVPGFIIQAGGYTATLPPEQIPTWPPVTNEYALSNIRGTVAMAKLGSDPNSATSQWFVNLADNSANLNNQNGGFTVFARVLGNGMTNVVDKIAVIPTYNAGSPFDQIPLKDLKSNNILSNNLVAVTRVATLPYFATSSNPDAFSAEILGTNLIVRQLTPTNGSSLITVSVSDTNGLSTNTSFRVTGFSGSQTITFPKITNQVYTSNSFPLSSLASLPYSTSKLPVQVKIASGPLSLRGTNYGFTGTGTVTLTARQAGNALYKSAATVTNSFTVLKAPQTIAPFTIIPSKTRATTFPIIIPKASSGLAVQVFVKSGPARFLSNTVTTTGVGTVTLAANQAGNTNYNKAPEITTSFLVK